MNQFLLTCFSVFTENQPQHLSQSTIVHKQKRIKPFLEYLEAKEIDSFADFDSSHVYEFMNSLNYSAQTKSGIAFATRNFFDILYFHGYSPFDGRTIFPVIFTNKRENIISYYTPDEVKAIINSIDTSINSGVLHKCIITLAAQTGLRASDIATLKYDEILWDKSIIQKVQYKTGNLISVPLPDNIKYLLLDYLKNYRPPAQNDYVFISPRKHKPFTSMNLYQIFQLYFRKAEIDINCRKHGPHALRHSLATNLLQNNTPMPVITGILGHSNINTTPRYLSIDIEGLRKAALEVPSL